MLVLAKRDSSARPHKGQNPDQRGDAGITHPCGARGGSRPSRTATRHHGTMPAERGRHGSLRSSACHASSCATKNSIPESQVAACRRHTGDAHRGDHIVTFAGRHTRTVRHRRDRRLGTRGWRASYVTRRPSWATTSTKRRFSVLRHLLGSMDRPLRWRRGVSPRTPSERDGAGPRRDRHSAPLIAARGGSELQVACLGLEGASEPSSAALT